MNKLYYSSHMYGEPMELWRGKSKQHVNTLYLK